MRRTTASRTTVMLGLAILAVALLAAAACSPKPEAKLTPKVAPPVIGQPGVLRAGVDLGYPPFGGTDKGVNAGLDVDVAAALAERLGLTLQLVSVTPSDAVAALTSGTVDVVIAALPVDGPLLADVTFAGSYVSDGPCFFTADESAPGTASAATSVAPAAVETLSIDALGERAVGVQSETASYWLLEDELGPGVAIVFPTLREALQALSEHQLAVVVADGLTASYIARDFPNVRYAGQAASAKPLGVAVAKDATGLEEAVREALDGLAADGVLDQLRSKWSTPLPELEVERTEP
ncbi:MAG: amino acid ABC transporter substrate-binding protein [Actinobacteria bacterium]|nr:MAG: amino acid ABC transporter substrate-binding protein [Actinomycetota bacterium]